MRARITISNIVRLVTVNYNYCLIKKSFLVDDPSPVQTVTRDIFVTMNTVVHNKITAEEIFL